MWDLNSRDFDGGVTWREDQASGDNLTRAGSYWAAGPPYGDGIVLRKPSGDGTHAVDRRPSQDGWARPRCRTCSAPLRITRVAEDRLMRRAATQLAKRRSSSSTGRHRPKRRSNHYTIRRLLRTVRVPLSHYWLLRRTRGTGAYSTQLKDRRSWRQASPRLWTGGGRQIAWHFDAALVAEFLRKFSSARRGPHVSTSSRRDEGRRGESRPSRPGRLTIEGNCLIDARASLPADQ